MLGDKVRIWRLNNILKTLQKSKDMFEFSDDKIQLRANPKVSLAIIENAGNEDNEEIQQLWAGLFNSSLSEDGSNDEGILYVNLLKQLSSSETKLLKHLCEEFPKGILKNGLPIARIINHTLSEKSNLHDDSESR